MSQQTGQWREFVITESSQNNTTMQNTTPVKLERAHWSSHVENLDHGNEQTDMIVQRL